MVPGVYVLVMFYFHPLLGWFALGGTVLLMAVGWINERVSRTRLQKAGELAIAWPPLRGKVQRILVAERDGLTNIRFDERLLQAEREGNPHAVEIIQVQQQLFDSRHSAQQATLDGLEATLCDLREQHDSLQRILQSRRDQRETFERQLAGQRSLADDQGRLVQLQGQVQEYQLRLIQQREDYQKELRTALAETRTRTADLGSRLDSAQYEVANMQILVPTEGIVAGLTVFTQVGVVSAGDKLMDIVPLDQPLMVEGRLPVQDVDKGWFEPVSASMRDGLKRGLRSACKAAHPVSIGVVAVLLFVDAVPMARAQTQLSAPPTLLHGLEAVPQQVQAQAQASASVALSGHSQSLDLVQAYERMLLNDPQILGARAAREAGRDVGNISRAALLPQASINYLRNRTNQTEYYDSTAAGRQSMEDRYYGRRAGLTIEQALFDYSAISTYRMGKTQVEYAYAEVQYRLQFQQQAVALIDAYLNALLARDSLELARHQLRVYQDMLRGNERMMTQGEGTRIDILETRTQVGATQSELVTYENALADKLRELSALLGGPVYAHDLLDIDQEALLPALPDGDLKVLLGYAQQQNPKVQATRLAVRYNDLTVEREKGQFMPRVSLYASHERIASDTVDNRGRDYKTNTIGLQVSIPLSTRQAANRREQARYELGRTTHTTATPLEQYYRVFATSAKRVRTLRQNVTDSTALVEAMRKNVVGGERTNTDALQAERQSYQARQELLRTYVEWFQAYAKLQFYAGRFSEDDVLVLNPHLVAHVR